MHNTATTYFFELLQMSVGRREGLSGTPTKAEWKTMFGMAHKQALVGVFTDVVCRLPQEQCPPRKPLLRLYSDRVMVENANRRLFGKCCDLTEGLATDGFDTCILKGQGLALLYPKPLLRQSGDIDVWVKASLVETNTGSPLKQGGGLPNQEAENTIYIYARERGALVEAEYHHVGTLLSITRGADGGVVMAKGEGTADEVEMHFRPSFMFSPRHNRRIQAWFEAEWSQMKTHTAAVEASYFATDHRTKSGSFNCPTPAFNIIYVLTHIYRHLFDEGIGLRQLLDYYYVLMAYNNEADAARRATTMAELKCFGLYRFAEAVMYVLHVVFALPEDEMLVPMNAKRGRFLLDEILRAGNFGKHDDRVKIKAGETPLHKLIRRQRHSMRLLRYFPGEVLWQPYFKFWHRHWRLKHGWIKSMSQD